MISDFLIYLVLANLGDTLEYYFACNLGCIVCQQEKMVILL